MRIGLFRGRGTVSTLIRWQTRSKYSHAGIFISDNTVMEAWPTKGVRINTLLDLSDIDFFDLETTPRQEAKIIEFFQKQMGKPYDYFGVFNFITKFPSFKPYESWFCSEIVFAALQEAGILLLRDIEPNKVSPFHISISPILKQIK